MQNYAATYTCRTLGLPGLFLLNEIGHSRLRTVLEQQTPIITRLALGCMRCALNLYR